METPLSTRIVTVSHILVSSANNENLMLTTKGRAEESENSVAKSRQTSGKKPKRDQSALVDVTNDSPIVGLAVGKIKTPSSAMSKKRYGSQSCYTRTPGSGEVLLRGQVKTLLQKVNEEAEISRITIENRPFFTVPGLINTPLFRVAAPTPSNMSQVLMVDGKHLIPQMVGEMSDKKNQEEFEPENLIIRSLLQEFSEKSELSDSLEEEEEKDYDDDDDDGTFDELCEEMSRISVDGAATKFTGKHIRFVYSSDEELLGDEEEVLNS
ncbi:uncharacterized protein [Henckelia pumila]|uniref:uncharacterized protein n=1 Tax=Henckelia pumila TaxID=405737 RepID=UPI003C6DEC8C